ISALIKKLDESTKKTFIEKNTDAQIIPIEINLTSLILGNKKPLSVVCAGSVHTCMVEEALLKGGFQNIYLNKDLKNGLKVLSCNEVKWPEIVPSSFISPLWRFLELCEICQKEDASNKCGA